MKTKLEIDGDFEYPDGTTNHFKEMGIIFFLGACLALSIIIAICFLNSPQNG